MKIPPDVSTRIHRRRDLDQVTANWGSSVEDSWLLVLEAYRRYLEVTQDQRLAAGLTLAWAQLEGGSR
ncbi:MAG: hypothetical protein FJ189_13645 [Gammaproteobacteria bacterium]|nr:hypothetical protein [Gammaproteobacteria bacterium]